MTRQGNLGATSRSRVDHLVDAYLRAETAADVDTILSLVTDDVEVEQFGGPDGLACGPEAVRARYQTDFANSVHEHDNCLRRLYGDGFVVDDRTWEGRVIGRLGPFAGGGRRISHRALYLFELRDDRIARVSIYRDLATIMRQLS